MRHLDAENFRQRRTYIDISRQRIDISVADSRHRNQQRSMPERFVNRHRWFAPDVLLAEIMPVIGAYDHRSIVVKSAALDRREQFAEPRVDHRQLRAVARANLRRLLACEHAMRQRPAHVRRPDHVRSLPRRIVHRGVRLRRVERLVRIELVDEQHKTIVTARRALEPFGRRRHRARPWKIRLVAKVAPRVVVRSVPAGERRRAYPARIGPRLPRVALMPALVVPRGEIGVIVLAADLEQMRMIRDQLGDDASGTKIRSQRPLPYFDRAPRLPQKIDRAAKNVVTRRDAWQRARVMTVEANRAARETIEIGRRELAPAVRTEHVTIEAVEQY